MFLLWMWHSGLVRFLNPTAGGHGEYVAMRTGRARIGRSPTRRRANLPTTRRWVLVLRGRIGSRAPEPPDSNDSVLAPVSGLKSRLASSEAEPPADERSPATDRRRPKAPRLPWGSAPIDNSTAIRRNGIRPRFRKGRSTKRQERNARTVATRATPVRATAPFIHPVCSPNTRSGRCHR